ncbi:hypothetical protein [Streptomyces sp. NBC_01235]|uniref:hypothetical protein n=1 Tax=Streptomyces sp. NBC_01235 TaxID=2903788 RepID=UPI002E128B9E|nr:hypothetical protein OG289_44720 [Streptomyces sp. NBC_01235]
MRSSRPDSPDSPAFPGPPRTVTDSRVRTAVHAPGWHEVSDGTRAVLAEFYECSDDLDDDEFDDGLRELVDTHADLKDLVQQSELNDDSQGPRGVDMPPEPDPGAAGLPGPFGTPNPPQQQPPQPVGEQPPATGNGSNGGGTG